MSISWVAKVEYQSDKVDTVIKCTWIKDLLDDELPAFDPHRIYHGFWSPLAEDTPEIMLTRVPEIPFLTEEQEKEGLPGYYRICILAIDDDAAKFETNRVRKSTQRGSKTSTRRSSTKSGGRNSKSKISTTGSSKSTSSESKADTEKSKHRASKTNLGNSKNKETVER